MKFAVVLLAVVAAASAQYNFGYNGLYNNGLYRNGYYNNGYYNNLYNHYDPYNPYNPYSRNPYHRFGPYGYHPLAVSPSSTVAPAVSSSTSAPKDSTSAASGTPAPASVIASPVVARVLTDDAHADTLRSDNDLGPDGSYAYSYETSNGIAAQEHGAPRNLGPAAPIVAEGAFSWTSPEGHSIAATYVADENGYHPSYTRFYNNFYKHLIKK